MQVDDPSSRAGPPRDMQKSTPSSRKRRRVELACTACREKKSRCDGQRPQCSACLFVQTECIYNPIPQAQSIKPQNVPNTQAELTKRVENLEVKLDLISSTPQEEVISEGESYSAIDLRSRQQGTEQTGSSIQVETLKSAHLAEELQVDTLASEVFDDTPERNIGYFGPTSNHFLFRTVSDLFANSARIFSQSHGPRDAERSYRPRTRPSSPRPVEIRDTKSFSKDVEISDIYYLPASKDFKSLLNRFFVTIGSVLPYISKSLLLSKYQSIPVGKAQYISRSERALLNIIFAHTHASTGDKCSEIFYKRALSLLDEKTLRGSSIEMVQALLLLSSFQQNNQRSIASWTSHSLAVKAALQLGLHSPIFYQNLGLQEQELCKRLWFAVINQDRYLGVSLGRPFLISQQLIRIQRPQDIDHASHTMTTYADSFKYFNFTFSLHEIEAAVVNALYDHNIDSGSLVPLHECMASRFQLAWQLQQWRARASSIYGIISEDDTMSNWTPMAYDLANFRILLSIQFYRVSLLADRPVILGFLNTLLHHHHHQKDGGSELLEESILPVIKANYAAAKQLQRLIHGSYQHDPLFLDRNAAWWTCNYSILTVALHLFAVLLIAHNHPPNVCNPYLNTAEIRASIQDSLETLQLVERTSLMSRKGRHCILRLLEIFDSMSSPSDMDIQLKTTETTAPSDDLDWLSEELVPENQFPDFISRSIDDFLFQCSQNSFLDADLRFEPPS